MPPQSSDDALLSTALACRNRLYVERGVLLSKIDAKYRAEMGPSASRTFEQICLVESEVLSTFCNDYLKSFCYFKPTATPSTMSRQFSPAWTLLEQLLATMRYAQNALCFQDYTTPLPADYAVLHRFFQQITWISDAQGMAKCTLQHCLDMIDAGKSFRRATLDERELIAFLHLIVAHYEREIFIDDIVRKEFVDRVLRELHRHYKSTYLSFAERLGTLMSILGEFHAAYRSMEHFDTVASLYREDPAVIGLTPDEQAILDFGNPQRSIKLEF
ncbi:hypothetical protein AAVH_18023 [Aphelenchoides avenae]|nr:hypothetical protein AAVH_18023 [Aphelenchus avenae]